MKIMTQTNSFKKSVALLGIGAALLLTTGTARAQVGSGWAQFFPDSYIQIESNDVFYSFPPDSTVVNVAGVQYTNKNGIETFMLVNHHSNRVERRYYDNYSDRRQFEGYVMVTGPTEDEKIHQIFCANPDGPYFLISAYTNSGGEFKALGGGGGTLITGCYGTWVRINSIHDQAANLTDIYINGSLKSHGTWGSGISYYTKYGDYGTLMAAYSEVQYKNVKMFQTGSGGGIDTSAVYHLQNEASGLALNQQGSLTNGSKITQWSSSSTSQNLQWTFIPTDSGYYQINSVKSGLDAVVQSASTSQGAGIIQWSFGSAQNDQWLPQQNSDGSFTFVNRHSGLVLEDPGSSTSTSTQMDQWGSNGGANQKWKLIKQ